MTVAFRPPALALTADRAAGPGRRYADALLPLPFQRRVMTDDDLPEDANRAFEGHDAYEPAAEGYRIETTRFDARVTASDDAETEWALTYELTVRAPMLSAAVADDAEEQVGPAVEAGWLDTFELRVADAPGAVRDGVEADVAVHRRADEAVVEYTFEWGNADRAADIAKAFAEFVEGTYMEGIVPGYDYGPPVSEMLASARASGGDEGSGDPMPL